MNKQQIRDGLKQLQSLPILADEDVFWKPQGYVKEDLLVVVPYMHVISIQKYLNQYFDSNWRIEFDTKDTNVKATIVLFDDDGEIVNTYQDVADIKETKGGKDNDDSDADAATRSVRRAFRWMCAAALECWRSGRIVKAWAYEDSKGYPKFGVDVEPSWAYVIERWNAGDLVIIPPDYK